MTITMQHFGLGSLIGAGAVAAVFALGSRAVGYPAVARADPNNGGGTGGEWDNGIYDNCMKKPPDRGINPRRAVRPAKVLLRHVGRGLDAPRLHCAVRVIYD
jgi:hypothetical protein